LIGIRGGITRMAHTGPACSFRCRSIAAAPGVGRFTFRCRRLVKCAGRHGAARTAACPQRRQLACPARAGAKEPARAHAARSPRACARAASTHSSMSL
jgi:hypothetical protein